MVVRAILGRVGPDVDAQGLLRGGTGDAGSKAAERFIVGTLASFLWAALIGMIGVAFAGALD